MCNCVSQANKAETYWVGRPAPLVPAAETPEDQGFGGTVCLKGEQWHVTENEQGVLKVWK